MRRLLQLSLSSCCIALSCLVAPSSFAALPPATEQSMAPMLKAVMPAIVNIRGQIKITDLSMLRELERQQSAQNNRNPLPKTLTSVGSGVIVDAKNGYIITNAHVVKDAQTITVTLSDSRHFTAKVIGLDSPSDVALLQIKTTDLTAVPIGNSNDLQVGDYVAAIGNPYGLSQTVTSGIISALGRTTLGIESFESFIQTDASINPGNSGGALINMQGQLIGINTAILAPTQGSIGIGFAIPSNMVKSVMEQLIRYGDVKRGVLGIGAQDITPDLVTAFNLTLDKGAAVTQVLPGSPAAQAGFQVGDIVTNVNGTPVKNASDVINTIGFLRVDSKINIQILRQNKPMTISVTLSDPIQRDKTLEQSDPFLYGMTLKNFSALSPVHGNVKGVLVMDVKEDSKAALSDVRAGDIITSVNQQTVNNIDELKAAAAKSDKTMLINVIRGASAVFLVINRNN
jgi:serine protease Do